MFMFTFTFTFTFTFIWLYLSLFLPSHSTLLYSTLFLSTHINKYHIVSNKNKNKNTKANINIHKLDAAFDIDPLFHKMSKNFDEGGAKGLLLANLSVGYGGCKIIFDSTLDDDVVDDDKEEQPKNKNDNTSSLEDVPEDVPQEVPAAVSSDNTTVVDVTSLVKKLESLLISSGGSSGIDGINNNTTSDNDNTTNTIGSMSLVPQLASLRDQFADLKNDGFVDEIGISVRIRIHLHGMSLLLFLLLLLLLLLYNYCCVLSKYFTCRHLVFPN
jgi:hypothetical protein